MEQEVDTITDVGILTLLEWFDNNSVQDIQTVSVHRCLICAGTYYVCDITSTISKYCSCPKEK